MYNRISVIRTSDIRTHTCRLTEHHMKPHPLLCWKLGTRLAHTLVCACIIVILYVQQWSWKSSFSISFQCLLHLHSICITFPSILLCIYILFASHLHCACVLSGVAFSKRKANNNVQSQHTDLNKQSWDDPLHFIASFRNCTPSHSSLEDVVH